MQSSAAITGVNASGVPSPTEALVDYWLSDWPILSIALDVFGFSDLEDQWFKVDGSGRVFNDGLMEMNALATGMVVKKIRLS